MSLRKNFDIFKDELNGGYQVRTKTEVVVIEFDNPEKEAIFNSIITIYDSETSVSFEDIKHRLSHKHKTEDVTDVVQELLNCGVLDQDNLRFTEGSLTIVTEQSFSRGNKATSASKYKVGFIGNTKASKIFSQKAKTMEFGGFTAVTLPKHFAQYEEVIGNLFDSHDFVIVDNTSWHPHALNIINSIAIDKNKPWILIEGKTSAIHFSISPIFHGNATGCYECYRRRLRSNDEFEQYTLAYEEYLISNKTASVADKVHDFIWDAAASIIIMDITKYLCNWYIPETWRTNILINIQNYQIERHSFLKTPFCPVCKPEVDYSPYPWLEEVTLE